MYDNYYGWQIAAPTRFLCTNYHYIILDARRHHASEQPPKAALSESQSERSEPKDLILHFLHKTIN